MRVQVLLLENLRNCSPRLCALVIQEETPSPLPVGCLTDVLPQLTRQYRIMVASVYRLILFLSSAGGAALPGCPLRLSVSYQACTDTPLPEVYPPGDHGSYFSGPMDAQHICEDDMVKEEGPLGVPCTPEYPPPSHSQDGREPAPYRTRDCGIPASQLHS